MPPRGVCCGVRDDRFPCRVPDRLRPRPFRWRVATSLGLPAPPGLLGHADQRAKPRSRHARVGADYPEVRKGPNRPSALFFQTRISIAASPRACVNSATSASNCSSRLDGPVFPATSAALPPSKNSAYQRPIDCSDTFSRRAASARLISPAKIDSTIRIFFSDGITGGLPIVIGSLQQEPIIP